MKKLFYLIILFLMSLAVYAQTQKGIVKTRGRMINGQLVPGEGLNDATIKLYGGRNMTSKQVGKDKGVFSFPVPSQTFRVTEVLKNGYLLVDADVVSRTRKYSSEPLYLVMETPEQQQEDKLAAERKIRRTLTRQLQEREDEIELLKSQNKLSQEAYQKALQKLYAEQQDNERLISDMAKEYALLDYDQMDDFYRQVAYCIENGQLSKADSLLRSKGDVNAQVEEQLKRGQAIQQAKEELTKAEAVHEAGNEELAQRCYRFYETFLMKHQNDSAAHYLELRARLDTTNLYWQNEAGFFIDTYLADYTLALTYYQRVLRQALAQYGKKNDWVAVSYNNIGFVNYNQGLYNQAQTYHQKALEIRKEVLGERHTDVATSYNNIGLVYYRQGSFTQALEYYQKALDIWKEVVGEKHPDVALTYNNIGCVYDNQSSYTLALEYYQKAIKIWKEVIGEKHPDVAQSYNNIGVVYDRQGLYSQALEYYRKALEIRKEILDERHPDVATSYNNIGGVYLRQSLYSQALEYDQKALMIWKEVVGEKHPDVATCYNNIGFVFYNQGLYNQALEYYQKALDIRKEILGEKHPDVAQSYNNIGLLYNNQGLYTQALEYYQKALEIWKDVFGERHIDVATSYYNIGYMYFGQGLYNQAKDCLQKTLDINKEVFGDQHPNTIEAQNNLSYPKYMLAISEGDVKTFCEEHCFTATIVDGDTPARQQGMEGEYILLEFADWNQNSTTSLFSKNKELRGKPVDILVLKNGIITQYHFENTIGAQFRLKYVGKEERQRINKAYEDWKSKNRK